MNGKVCYTEHLLLIERLVESIRHIHAETSPQAMSKAPQKNISKWARLARRVKENPIALGDYTVQLKHDMQAFKDNFAFKHDES
ncbi:hypothetical protein [Candidatus Venteria ishoeyi]|uniref:Uncharacterized protein n=1 Tax=Candidatus Venteria ishoeyi TaxID=1899563 RepID=A0A1H6F6X7_9GAMM|nr:hypothetical protein [Candidatus Venteria ishoeyi]SEH05855.1 Uncharacterised protein [Candidatus Venteria ishoeyi]SEH05888.1 Uncharacterised protein [Candidatus Venteria ishoeyi]